MRGETAQTLTDTEVSLQNPLKKRTGYSHLWATALAISSDENTLQILSGLASTRVTDTRSNITLPARSARLAGLCGGRNSSHKMAAPTAAL